MTPTSPTSQSSPVSQTTGRYARTFAKLRADGRKAYIPFTLLGWPNREMSLSILQQLADSGATALELGLAFSDPVADGPVIQQAAKETIEAGFNVDDALALLTTFRAANPDIPIGLLVYYNMVLHRGIDRFFADLAGAGVDGVLIADISVEVIDEVKAAADAHGIALIMIVSPLTTPARLTQIAAAAGGFLYVVSRLGITGTHEDYDPRLQDLLSRIHAESTLPACVGFGISTPAQAQSMAQLGADGVITGSRIIQLIQNSTPDTWPGALSAYVQSMVNAVN
ncbi:MAG: tryptophan synthase subunit alpha [Candidatus Melainabacteria bacterium]